MSPFIPSESNPFIPRDSRDAGRAATEHTEPAPRHTALNAERPALVYFRGHVQLPVTRASSFECLRMSGFVQASR